MNDTDRNDLAAVSDTHFFRKLADGAPVMIWMSGLDMGCFYFNRGWLDFRGRTLEEESGNNWAEGVHPADLQRCVSHYVSCFERRIAFAMSYRLRHFTGRYEWILDRGAPHYAADGSFLGFFGGCAEIESADAVTRHAELGVSLAQMKDFARRIAAADEASLRATSGLPLETLARKRHDSHRTNVAQLRRAAADMERLASDMLEYREIEKGACLPAVGG